MACCNTQNTRHVYWRTGQIVEHVWIIITRGYTLEILTSDNKKVWAEQQRKWRFYKCVLLLKGIHMFTNGSLHKMVNIYLHGPVHGVISLVPGHLVLQQEVSVFGCHILQLVLLAELELEEAEHSLLQVCAPFLFLFWYLQVTHDACLISVKNKCICEFYIRSGILI